MFGQIETFGWSTARVFGLIFRAPKSACRLKKFPEYDTGGITYL